MKRLDEINLKHDQIRALLRKNKAGALWLRRPRNIAWFTAGCEASIALDSETGAYSLVVTEAQRLVYTDNIEIVRLRAEEKLESLGFEYVEAPWHAFRTPDLPNLLNDLDAVESDLQQLRWALNEGEQERLRALGRDTADALDEAAHSVGEGFTELEIAARLDSACRRRGGAAIVNLIGADERISKFRHPLPTENRLKQYAMLIVCMRRGGLIAAATRLVHLGPVPQELDEKLLKVAYLDAAAMVASQPGRTLGDVFGELQKAYVKQSEDSQWKLHHQGGLIAYMPRERIAAPGDATALKTGHALAWNPSIVGCKSEDTILLTESGFEIVTAAPNWPMVQIEIGRKVVQRPGILEL